MRHSLLYTLLVFVLVIAACKKKSNNTTSAPLPPSAKTDSLGVSINGTAWLTYNATVILIPYTADSGAYNLQLAGSTTVGNANTNMQLYITNYKGPAVYTVNPPTVSVTYYIGNSRHYATSGSITVTSDSTSFTGNFNFSADTLNATGGIFAVPR